MHPFPFYWSYLSLPLVPNLLRPSRLLILLLLFVSGIYPNPGPPRVDPNNNVDPNLNFLQFNVNGIQNSHAELSDFILNNSTKIACIQETKLSVCSKPPAFPGFAFVRKDRPVGGGGGLAILVDHSIPYKVIDTSTLTDGDPSLELLGIQIEIGSSQLEIFNVYYPPVSSCPTGHRPDFTSLLNFMTLFSLETSMLITLPGIPPGTPAIPGVTTFPLLSTLLTSAP
jgi:hypothetical protein